MVIYGYWTSLPTVSSTWTHDGDYALKAAMSCLDTFVDAGLFMPVGPEPFDQFEREAFRLATLDDYSRSGNVDAYQLFLDGQDKPADYNLDWLDEVRTHTDAGRRMYRVHVLRWPLAPYLRFELG